MLSTNSENHLPLPHKCFLPIIPALEMWRQVIRSLRSISPVGVLWMEGYPRTLKSGNHRALRGGGSAMEGNPDTWEPKKQTALM